MSTKSNASRPALYLVRHGDTDANDPRHERFRSWDEEIGLSTIGKRHAEVAAQTLAPLGIAFLISSDLRRAVQTAGIVGEELGLTPQLDRTLRDWNVGIYIGLSVKEFLPHVKKFETQMPDTPIPGGEAYSTFWKRWGMALIRGLHAVETMGISGAYVTHQRCIYSVNNILTNGAAPIKWGGPPAPGGVARLYPGAQHFDIIENVSKERSPNG